MKNPKRILSLLLVLVMVFSMFAMGAVAAPASSQLYVLADLGDDDNPGTKTSPFLTIGAALSHASDDTEIVLLSDIPLSKELVIDKNVTISSENGKSIVFTGSESIGTTSGIIKIMGGANVQFHDITLSGSQGKIEGRVLYVDNASVALENTTITAGQVDTVSTNSGGGGIYVGNNANVTIGSSVAIINNVTVANGGGIYVADGGKLVIDGENISISGNSAKNGGGLYVATQTGSSFTRLSGDTDNGLVFSNNTATDNGGAMYVEKDAKIAVSGEVTAYGHTIKDKANNVFLAKDATLDISGYTGGSSLGITPEDEYAYRLVSDPVDDYTIKTCSLNTADEAYWEDDCDAWDIRYLNYQDHPGLYLIYHTINAEFEDVDTLTTVMGNDLCGDKVDYLTAELPDKTNKDGLLTVPSIVTIGNDEDAVFTITCNPDEYRIPTEDIVKVVSGGKDVPFTYEPDFENGTATITISRDEMDKLTSTIHFVVTAEKYHLLTVQANGPLYAMASSITGRTATPLTVTGGKQGTEASYTVMSSEGAAMQGVDVNLYKEGASSLVSGKTGENGVVLFTNLEEDASYYAVVKYAAAFKVIDRDVITFDPISTMEGQTLAPAATLTAGNLTYQPADSKATVANVTKDATVTFSVQQTLDTIYFIGNEGVATTQPATITLGNEEGKGSLTKQMEASASTVGVLPTAEMQGYTFLGWFDNQDGEGDAISSDTTYTANSNPTYYAKWAANTDTAYQIQHWVEYAENGVNEGMVGDPVDGYYLYETTDHTYTSDAVADISGLDLETMSSDTAEWWTREGFTAKAQQDCKVLANGSSVFAIYYDRNVYDVSFRTPLEAGTAVNRPEIPDQTAKFGVQYGTLPDPKLPGYNYNQSSGVWYDGDSLVTATTVFTKTEDVELVAKWNPNNNTKWAIKLAVREIVKNEDGVSVQGDNYIEYRTVYKDDDGNLLMGTSDTEVSMSIGDIAGLTVEGFHFVGYSGAYDPSGTSMTESKDAFTVAVKPTDASTEKDGQFNGDFNGSIVWLYYDRNKLPVIFIDGQDEETEDEIIFGGDFEGHLPPAPGKDGYDFVDWVDPDGTPIKDDTEASEYVKDGDPLVVTPTWTARKYQLTYVPGNGCTFIPAPGTTGKVTKSTKVSGGYIDPREVTYDEPFGVLPTAGRAGYNFIAWATETGVVVSEDMTVTVDNVVISNAPTYNYEDTRPLYAQYTPHTYTLKFDPRGGILAETAPSSITVTYDAPILGLPTPSRTGYRFVEWRLRVDSPDTKLEEGMTWSTVKTDKSTVTAYAIWVPETFRYNFDLNDEIGSTRGTLVDTDIDFTEETFDTIYDGVVAVEATRDGYIFEGWSLTPDGDVLTKETINAAPENTTVYAIWTPKEYRVTLEMKGGTIADLSDNEDLSTYDPSAVYDVEADTWTITIVFDAVYGELPVPTKADCVYRGYLVNGENWPTNDNFGPSIHGTIIQSLPQYIDFTDYDGDPDNGVNKGITLTAVLEPYFTFDPDGGKFEDDTEAPKKILQSDIDKMPEVTKDGYEQDGWLDKDGNSVTLDNIKDKTEPEVLRPKYVAKVTLDANKGQVNGKDVDTLPLKDDLTKLPTPTRTGHTFDGWFTEPDGGKLVTLDELKKANAPITLYAHWTARSYGGSSGGSGGGHASTPAPLLTGKHIAYIIGRNDGLVHPEANITRAEVATIFYRLLTDDARAKNQTTTNPFVDVEDDAWYTKAVCTLANMDIIKGRGADNFDPTAEITRAELAVIAARFDKLEDGTVTFPDVSTDHWAYKEITSSAAKGWVKGRGDGNFAPDTAITRAEVVTLINRVLNRASMTLESIVTTDHMTVWPDNMDTSAWYYLAMQEATNEHNHKMDNKVEYWTKLLPISQMP